MSQQKRDYYEVLGIDKTADPATIKKAYRKLAKKYHPDSNVGNAAAAEKFKEVNEAYDILSDPEKKKLYDQFGHAAFDGTGAAGAGFDGAMVSTVIPAVLAQMQPVKKAVMHRQRSI